MGAQNWENTTTRGATRLVLRGETNAEKVVRVRELRVDAAFMAKPSLIDQMTSSFSLFYIYIYTQNIYSLETPSFSLNYKDRFYAQD